MSSPQVSGGSLSRLTRALEDWDIVGAEQVVRGNQEQLVPLVMDVVPLVCSYITPHTEEAGPHLTNCCQTLLLLVSQTSSPKEMLVALLEQLDQFQASVCVGRLLPALSCTLARVKTRGRAHSWNWALNTVTCHLTTLPSLENTGLEGLERLSLELGETAQECIQLLEGLVTFVEPLVDLVATSDHDQDTGRVKKVLRKFLLTLLGQPCSLLPLHPEKGKEDRLVFPACSNSAGLVVDLLGRITSNMLTDILDIEETDHQLPAFEDEEPLPKTSVGTYLYLALGERVGAELLPSVYSKLFLLQRSAPHIVLLLGLTPELQVHKGLLLLHQLLSDIPPGSLDPGESDNPALTELITPLVRVIVFHDIKEFRQLGFSSYKMLVSLFCPEGRYNMYNLLLNKVNHSGLLGWTISSLKDTVCHTLTQTPHPLYSGPSLARLICPLFSLSHGAQTDLLEVSDEVLATINMATFLLIRDKDNMTGVQDLKASHIRPWADQLTEGLKLSTAHYMQKLKEDPGQPVDTSVVVGGRELPHLDRSKMEEVVRSAIHTFDLMQFNLARVSDLLDK